MNTSLPLAILLGVLTNPLSSPAQSIESAAVAREEYAIYSVALKALDEEFQYHTPELVISNPTIKGWALTKGSVQFVYPGPTGAPETFADYLQRNKTNRWLERRLDLNFKYEIVGIEEIKKLVNNFQPLPEWKEFSEKYRGAAGFVAVSRVGLNPPMDEALVYLSWQCGTLCGRGEAMLLSKPDGQWEIVNRSTVVVY